MPTLPDVRSLGKRQTPRATRQLVQVSNDPDVAKFAGAASLTISKAVEGATDDIVVFAEKRQKQEDDIRLVELQEKVSVEEKKLHEEGGVFTRKGRSAMGAGKEFEERFKATRKKLLADLPPRLQARAAGYLQSVQSRNAQRVAIHEQNEMTAHQKVLLESRIDTARETFIGAVDKADVVRANAEMKLAVMARGKLDGLDPSRKEDNEILQKRLRDNISAGHLGRMDRMVAAGQGSQVREYLAAHRKEIDADDLAKVEKAVFAAGVLGEAQGRADTIVASHKSVETQLAAARKIKDPEVRAKTVSLVRDRFNENKAIEASHDRDMRKRAWTLVQDTKDLSKLTPSMRAAVSGPQLAAMERYVRGDDVKTDPRTYNALATMPADEFAKVDLTGDKYVGKLSNADFRRMSDRQGRLINAKSPADKTATQTRTQIVNAATKSMSDEKKMLVNRRLDEQIELVEAAKPKGQKATAKEIRSILDELLFEVDIDGGAWFAKERLFQVKAGQEFTVDADDIPASDRQKIAAWFKRKEGRDPTNEELTREYAGYLRARVPK